MIVECHAVTTVSPYRAVPNQVTTTPYGPVGRHPINPLNNLCIFRFVGE